ncbi:hypothetical protein Tco_0434573 [Tanacetum coccineum]
MRFKPDLTPQLATCWHHLCPPVGPLCQALRCLKDSLPRKQQRLSHLIAQILNRKRISEIVLDILEGIYFFCWDVIPDNKISPHGSLQSATMGYFDLEEQSNPWESLRGNAFIDFFVLEFSLDAGFSVWTDDRRRGFSAPFCLEFSYVNSWKAIRSTA